MRSQLVDFRPTSDQRTDIGKADLSGADLNYANLSAALLYRVNKETAL
nr:pentapeptide repeat-containing protein [Hydrococcus rivularis]